MVIWIVGLSGAGKTTLAQEIVNRVRRKQPNVVLIDGDMVRDVFGNDLGYSMEDRLANAKRICRLGKLLDDQGIHVVCAILSLFPETRDWNRANITSYYEVFIDTPMHDLVRRDSKGIYSRFLSGDIRNVAGMDIAFPRPADDDLIIKNASSRDEFLRYAEPIAAKLLSGCP